MEKCCFLSNESKKIFLLEAIQTIIGNINVKQPVIYKEKKRKHMC